MNISGEPKTIANKGESILILLLCFIATLRVLVFSAAFPFFTNIDEDLHFDLVTQYSHARASTQLRAAPGRNSELDCPLRVAGISLHGRSIPRRQISIAYLEAVLVANRARGRGYKSRVEQ